MRRDEAEAAELLALRDCHDGLPRKSVSSAFAVVEASLRAVGITHSGHLGFACEKGSVPRGKAFADLDCD